MKKRRLIAAACVGVMLVGLLTGCGRKILPLPEGMDEAALTAAGREVLSELLKGEYDKVADRFRADIRQNNDITEQTIRDMLEEWANPAVVGEFVKIKKISTSGEADGKTEKATRGYVLFDCEYTKTTVGIAMSYDPEMNLIGMSVGPEEKI